MGGGEDAAEAATPVASTSSETPSPAKYGSINPDGPMVPSVARHREQRHSRRPSRAERYEAVIKTARETLRRATGGYDEGDSQVGAAADPLTAERRRRSKRLSSASFEPLPERDWRETVRSLLTVVDGMSQQLASHDELATELKIAQSNLSLASAHSEFLEETLRRRESRTSASHLMSRQHSTGEQVPGLASHAGSRPGSAGDANDAAGGGAGLFGLGLSSEPDAGGGGAKSFFRLPSRRKSPNPGAPAADSAASVPLTRRLRSVGSSPVLNKGFFSSEPAPPLPAQPRGSPSLEVPASPDPNSGAASTTSPLAAEVFVLRTQVSSLETECTALRSTNASLRRNNESLVGKCAELEKTKDDLMSELENLSVELFSEANALVAEERRARAKAEEEVGALTERIESISAELEALRRQRSDGSGNASVVLPGRPATPTGPIVHVGQPFSASPDRSHDAAESNPERPLSATSVASSAARSWFSFGRAASQAAAPAQRSSAPMISTGPDARPGSTSSRPTAPGGGEAKPPDAASPVVKALGLQADPRAVEPSPSQAPGQGERARASSPKGKEKARTLDLGIRVPDGGDPPTLQSTFSATPDSGRHSAEHFACFANGSAESRSSGLRSPGSPQDSVVSVSPPRSALSRLSESGIYPQDLDEGLLSAPVRRRPRRPDGQAVPRPHAVHLDRTPPGLYSSVFSSNNAKNPAKEVTAIEAKSPKSPNELRWAQVAGSLQGGPAGGPSSGSGSEPAPEQRIQQGGIKGSSPPADGSAQVSAQGQQQASQRPRLQILDPASPELNAAENDSTRRRRHSAGFSISRPGFPSSMTSGSLPISTTRAALYSGPASANPAGPGRSLSRRGPAAAGLRSPLEAPTEQSQGLPQSTSLSSLASNSSISSAGLTSSSGHSNASTGRNGPGSPDDTKAAQDLENLMQNILEMSAGLFGQEGGEDGDVGAEGEGRQSVARPEEGGTAKEGPKSRPVSQSPHT